MKKKALKGKRALYFLFSILFIIACFSTSGNIPPKVHKVEIKGMKFQPTELTVRKGDTVEWINNDMVTHDVTEETKKAWTSKPIPVGKSWKMAVKQSTSYFCSIHPVMKGKIIVK